MPRPTLRLPIYARTTIGSDRSVTRSELVFCSREARTVDAACCRVCPQAVVVSSAAVECAPPASGLPSPQQAATVAVGAVVSTGFTCIAGDLSFRSAAPLLPEEPWALPVVDTRGRFSGFVSRATAGDSGLPPRLSGVMRVGDMAIGHALAIGEDRSLREATEAMALRHGRALALVDSEGGVRGLLTDLEALRAWIALRGGR